MSAPQTFVRASDGAVVFGVAAQTANLHLPAPQPPPSSPSAKQPKVPKGPGRTQLTLLRELDGHRYEFWQEYYVSSERLTHVLGLTMMTTTTTTTPSPPPAMATSPPSPRKRVGGLGTAATMTRSKSSSPLSLTDKFVAALDDEIDKAVVFFLDQQGQIARDLWGFWKLPHHQHQHQHHQKKTGGGPSPSQQLNEHALHLLRLVKFVDLNIRLVEHLLELHDQVIYSCTLKAIERQARTTNNNKPSSSSLATPPHPFTLPQHHQPRSIQSLYLAGKLGREAQTPGLGRLQTLFHPDSLRATVGIAATVYYRYIKRQARLHDRVNELGQSLKEVPSMNNLAHFLQQASTASASSSALSLSQKSTTVAFVEQDNRPDYEPGSGDKEKEEGDDEDDDDVEESELLEDEEDDDDFPNSSLPGMGEVRLLALTERMIQRRPGTDGISSMNSAAAYSLGARGDKLVGATLLRIDTAMAQLSGRTSSLMECLALPDLARRREDSFVSVARSSGGGGGDDEVVKGMALDDILTEHLRTVGGGLHERRARQYSSWLNLANSFLYMVSYYLVAPTSSAYAKRLGLDESLSGAIIGMTAFSALASTVLYSWWTSHSYKHALIFSSVCCLLGNLLYAAGLPLDSLTLVLVGRWLNGFGSARAINRRYIADAFSKAERTAASADFVASGAAGMSVGPGLAALMHFLIPQHPHDEEGEEGGGGSLWWQEENAAGWVMAVFWIIYLALLIPYFRDPPKSAHETTSTSHHRHHKQRATSTTTPKSAYTTTVTSLQSLYTNNNGNGTTHEQTGGNGEQTPLLLSADNSNNNKVVESVDLDENDDDDDDSYNDEETPLWKRPAALITIFLVFLLKLVLELVLSASAPVTGFYFGWSPSTTGWFLAALGLLVLPAIWFVTWASQRVADRYLILYSVLGTLLGCIVVLNYGGAGSSSYQTGQYMIGTVILFIFPNTMEAPTMSLLSKNIPVSLSRGLFNLGFFTTEAGFSGRVVADSVLTWLGSYGIEHLVNSVFGFLTLLNLVALGLVGVYMKVLVDPSKKND